MSGQFIKQMCANLEGAEVQYKRFLEYKEKWNQAKEAIKIRMGLQGIKTKIKFGELGVHRAIWISWERDGKMYFRQVGWKQDEESSDAIKYNWIWDVAREYFKEREYIKIWLGIKN